MNLETFTVNSSRQSAVRHLALVLFIAGGLAAAEAAYAQRPCLLPASVTGRTCSQATCVALQDVVEEACKMDQLFSCRRLNTCPALEEMRQRWIACALARDTVNATCWRGGDPGHLQQSIQAWQNVSNCNARIAALCNDPCTQSFDLSVMTAEPAKAVIETTSAAEAEIETTLTSLLERLAAEGKLEELLSVGGKVDESATSDSPIGDGRQEDRD